MARSSDGVAGTLAAILLLTSPAISQQKKSAYDILPPSTQAIVWISDGQELRDRWDMTQLAKLAADESVAPFFEEQRQEIERRLMDAGWRLKVRPKELRKHATGQIALAWTLKNDSPLKPYASALILDVQDRAGIQQELLKVIEAQLDPSETEKTELTQDTVTITKYSLPPRPGELIPQESFFSVVEGILLGTDDEPLLRQLIDKVLEKSEAPSLSTDADFLKGRELAEIDGQAQIEYFVRPLGFARVIRAMGGSKSKSNADVLGVLENQGFSSIRCICGQFVIAQHDLDVQHRGHIYAKHPLPKSAGVLDFLNDVNRDVPSFVGDSISSILVVNWNISDAFWRTEGLVDELAGTEGVFEEVIRGIKMDPNGPRIDIRADVLPIMTNDIYSIADNREGTADIDSRRSLLAVRVTDGEAMAKVVNDAMRGEPDAERVEFEGHVVWQVVHREDEAVNTLGGDFGDFAAPAPAPASDQPQPWLNNWAITVHEDYLMFASHLEMIEDAIRQAKLSATSPLLTSDDYQRVTAAIEQFGGNDASAWQVVRTDKAYRVQYELFRKGELRKSQSMLSSVLDRLFENDSEIESEMQVIQGESLPDFAEIADYLQPSGMMFRTTDDGWAFGSLLLGPAFGQTTEISQNPHIGTARVSHTTTEANR